MQYLLLRSPRERPTDSDDKLQNHSNRGIILGPWGDISFETGSLLTRVTYRDKFTTSEKVYLSSVLKSEELRAVMNMSRPVAASIPIRNSHVYYDGLYYARVTLVTAETLLKHYLGTDYDAEDFRINYKYVMYDPAHVVMPTAVGVGVHGKSYGRAMNLGGNGV